MMLRYALILLVVAIIMGALGLSGAAGTISSLIWTLFLISLGAAIVLFILSRRPRAR